MTAKEIMTRDVITVKPDTSIEELSKSLADNRISGTPVVNDDGLLTGIVTEKDLIRQNSRLHIPTFFRIFDAIITFEMPGKIQDEMRRIAATTVDDICTKDVITINPDTTISEIATIMTDKNVHLLPVVDAGTIVGIIGKVDMVRALSLKTDKD